ncbi:MAG TPA: glycosyltransferase family 2 protein [Roseiflexaceae bacterium]|nr:glycosyltransferase family 2 protein [Roseiflexaceae bacterium]
MHALDVSVILVNWNGSALLARALECLYGTVRESRYEVIVVDNASTDDSVAMVRARFPQATLLVNTKNIGFARANNQAARVARGRYLLLLNTDAFVHAGTVDGMVAFLDTHPDAGAVGCRLYYEDGTLQRSCWSFPTLATELWTALYLDRIFRASLVFGRYQMTHWAMDDTRPVDALLGACLMVRRDVVDRIGLFDEQFFMYSEEVDLCYRLRRAGYRSYYLHEVSATHIWGGSARQIPHESFLRLYRSRVQFFRKHHGWVAVWALKAVLLLSSLVRVLLGPLMFVVRRESSFAQIARNYLSLLRALWAF